MPTGNHSMGGTSTASAPCRFVTPDFGNVHNREVGATDRPRFQSPTASRPVVVSLAIAQRSLLQHEIESSITIIGDLKTVIESGGRVGALELLELETRLRNARSVLQTTD